MADSDKKAAVVGWPVIQSLSPAIHAYWRTVHNITGAYRRISCRSEQTAFVECIQNLIRFGYSGVNVTIPHKQYACTIADTRSETVRVLGVANMLTFEDGKIHAENSDVYGFERMMRLHHRGAGSAGRALVLGAGGAAPAICLALHQLGLTEIIVTNRSEERAWELTDRFDFVHNYCNWTDRSDLVEGADVLVNATSLGMIGENELQIDLSTAKPSLLVADIVYNPLETELIRRAKVQGLKTTNGLAMLMHQAVPGFEKWFGEKPEVSDQLSQYLVSKLQVRGKPPIKIGLTGSIGMGKSTAAKTLADQGAAVWDADGAVHRLYVKGGAAVTPVAEAFPGAIEDGAVSRARLAKHLLTVPDDFKLLEKIVHPLVAADRQAFIEAAERQGAKIVVLDIPLLFETGQSQDFDVLLVVTADLSVRRNRVLSRPGMTEEKFNSIVARQMPEDEKIMLADHVVYTDQTLEQTASDLTRFYRDTLENSGL